MMKPREYLLILLLLALALLTTVEVRRARREAGASCERRCRREVEAVQLECLGDRARLLDLVEGVANDE